jgi:uncharacterized protein
MKEVSSIPVVECAHCRSMGFPPLYVCRKCGETELKSAQISGEGTIYTYTTIRVAPEAFQDQTPYDIAIVELRPDLRVTARINAIAPGKLKIDESVVYEKMDENGYWFKLIETT